MDTSAATRTLIEATSEVLTFDPDSIHADTNFAEDLDADSLDLVEIAMRVEEVTGIDIGEQDLTEIRTIADAAALLVQMASAA